jgi:thiol-disulfide isomerase/thioredoxin
MKLPLPLIVFLAAGLMTAPLANAGELGDAAKPLKISEWIKGKPVDLAAAKGKQIVVVEFWATWCGPCRSSIPHLTEMQKKFKDVVFIGISDEDAETVKPFVKKMGDTMDYTVAVDDDKKTGEAYMGAFGIKGIPHAFIVDKEGRIIWNGHPMDGLDKALEEVVAGKFDMAKAKQRAVARQKMDQFIQAVASGDDNATLDKLGKELEALDAELGGIKPGEKFNAAEVRKQIKFEVTLREYQTALAAGKPAATLDLLETQLTESAPKDFKLDEFKDALTMNRTFSDYYRAITGRGDTNTLPELTKKLAATKIKHARALDEWAWTILTDERIKIRDVELAAKLAKAAVDASDGKEASPLDTYARALFESGKTSDAISTVQKAIAVAKNDEMRRQLEDTLKKYQEKAAAK